jgi:predicted DNA binding protein
MKYKEFKSNQAWLIFNYPSNMIQIEEQEGTYLFYTEETGSFRVTPLKVEDDGSFNAIKFLHKCCADYDGQLLENLKNNKYVFSISTSIDEDDDLTIYNWIFSKDNKIIYCSYTLDSSSIEDKEIIAEKDEVQKIIENLDF